MRMLKWSILYRLIISIFVDRYSFIFGLPEESARSTIEPAIPVFAKFRLPEYGSQ